MTVEAYWQAVARYWSGNLSIEETRHYQITGILAECAARERGSTLLPSNSKFNTIWAFQRFLLRVVAIRSDRFADLTNRKQFASRKTDRTMLLKKSGYDISRFKYFCLCRKLHSEFELLLVALLDAAA